MQIRFTLALACSMYATAYAQDKLPGELVGMGLTNGGRGQVEAPWSIVISSQEPDGAIKGKMNWAGRACNFTDLPFSGTYRDGTLELTAPEINSRCGAWTIKMKRTSASEFAFEGSATTVGSQFPSTVTLKPR